MQVMYADVWEYIFSFLALEDLGRINQTCKAWCSTENVWKERCLAYMPSCEQYQESWKQRFQIIYNWAHGRSILKERTLFFSVSDSISAVRLVKDTLIHLEMKEGCFSVSSFPFTTCINHPRIKNIISIEANQEQLFVLNDKAEIYCLNALDGEHIKTINQAPQLTRAKIRQLATTQLMPTSMLLYKPHLKPIYRNLDKVGSLACSETEVAIAYLGNVKAWDIASGLQTCHVSLATPVSAIYLLGQSIIVNADADKNDNSFQMLLINRIKKNTTPLQIANKLNDKVVGSDKYLALCCANENNTSSCHIYTEDLLPNAAFSRNLAFSTDYDIKIYQDWLIAHKNRAFRIVNIVNGQDIAHFTLDTKCTVFDFQCNDRFLFVGEKNQIDHPHIFHSYYSCHDFAQGFLIKNI